MATLVIATEGALLIPRSVTKRSVEERGDGARARSFVPTTPERRGASCRGCGRYRRLGHGASRPGPIHTTCAGLNPIRPSSAESSSRSKPGRSSARSTAAEHGWTACRADPTTRTPRQPTGWRRVECTQRQEMDTSRLMTQAKPGRVRLTDCGIATWWGSPSIRQIRMRSSCRLRPAPGSRTTRGTRRRTSIARRPGASLNRQWKACRTPKARRRAGLRRPPTSEESSTPPTIRECTARVMRDEPGRRSKSRGRGAHSHAVWRL